MQKSIEDRIKYKRLSYDHIVWHGKCDRCDSIRYVFPNEVKWLKNHYTDDIKGEVVKCKGGHCGGKCKIRGRISNYRACHLNEINRRT